MSLPTVIAVGPCASYKARITKLESALREMIAHCDSLRDYVCEGGSIRMIGAHQSVIAADAAIAAGYAILKDAP